MGGCRGGAACVAPAAAVVVADVVFVSERVDRGSGMGALFTDRHQSASWRTDSLLGVWMGIRGGQSDFKYLSQQLGVSLS